MLYTTLDLLRKHSACGQDQPEGSYCKLVASLPKGRLDDAPISLLHILESNGVEDAIWALRAATAADAAKCVAVELACRATSRALVHFEKNCPDDKRPHEAAEAARAYLRGDITRGELSAKRKAATAAIATYAATNYAAVALCAATAADYAAGSALTFTDFYASQRKVAAYAALAADHAAYTAYPLAPVERKAQADDMRALLLDPWAFD